MLLIAILFVFYFYFRKNPNFFVPLVRELSSTQKRLECLAISLVYVTICYLTRTVPFARLVGVTPGFVYGLVVKAFLVLATVLGNLLSIELWEREVWQGAYVGGLLAEAVPEIMPHGRGVEISRAQQLPWLEDLCTVVMGMVL